MHKNKLINVILPIPLDKTFYYKVSENLVENIQVGMRVTVPFGKRTLVGYVQDINSSMGTNKDDFTDIEKLKEILEIVDSEPVVSEEFFNLSRWIADYYACSWGQALEIMVPKKINLKVRKTKKKADKKVINQTSFFIPMPDQEEILKPIREGIKGDSYKTFMLHGISDSGKTEVYLQSIAHVLEKGKQAIFLVPEISLTPQIIEQFTARFGETIGIWHSRLSIRERYKTWEAIRSGKLKILIGTRSAIFAPFANLGIIIMDEEHDYSFKQEQKPMYHTREIAIFRARWNKALVILGSATPAVESYYRAQKGEFHLLNLKHRIEEREAPEVTIVNMSKEPKKDDRHIISNELKENLIKQIELSKQSILFINRRGYSTVTMCDQCGYVFHCPNCSVSFVSHLNEKMLVCHYCNRREKMPFLCPKCKNKYIHSFGFGTQKVEEVIKKMFPAQRILRLDLDTAYKKDMYEKMYSLFKNKKIDILIGTQMITKGFDFPGVSLVGVISADTMLYLPSFRSSENTFSLITQVSGRAGRGNVRGRVVIQTYNPGQYSIQAAKNGDFISFYNQEIEFRRDLNYPPFKHLISLVVRGQNIQRVVKEMENLKSALDIWIKKFSLEFIILGPSEAPHLKLSGKFRWQILIKVDKDNILKLVSLLKLYRCMSGLYLSIDVDPMDIM